MRTKGMNRIGKWVVGTGLLVAGVSGVFQLFVYEKVDVDEYLDSLTTDTHYELKQSSTSIGNGKLGSFLHCLKLYKPITEREVEGNSTARYTIYLKDGTKIGMSASNGKAHQFSIYNVEGDPWGSTKGYSIKCSLSLLQKEEPNITN